MQTLLLQSAVLQSLSDYQHAAKPLYFSFIVPEDVFPLVNQIPGIEMLSIEEISRSLEGIRGSGKKAETRDMRLRLKARVQWRIVKMQYLSGIEDQMASC